MVWFGHRPELFQRYLAKLRERVRPVPANLLHGSDADPEVIEIARANARRAGFADDIDFQVTDITTRLAPQGRSPGCLRSIRPTVNVSRATWKPVRRPGEHPKASVLRIHCPRSGRTERAHQADWAQDRAQDAAPQWTYPVHARSVSALRRFRRQSVQIDFSDAPPSRPLVHGEGINVSVPRKERERHGLELEFCPSPLVGHIRSHVVDRHALGHQVLDQGPLSEIPRREFRRIDAMTQLETTIERTPEAAEYIRDVLAPQAHEESSNASLSTRRSMISA